MVTIVTEFHTNRQNNYFLVIFSFSFLTCILIFFGSFAGHSAVPIVVLIGWMDG